MKKKQIKVLFVDDDRILGNLITDALTSIGYEVCYLSSLTAIEPMILEFDPNVIILDVEIGSKDGIDDSIMIRESFPNIPIIFISSHVDPSYIIRALSNGGATYLIKPFEVDVLAAYIDRYAIDKIDKIISFGKFTISLNNYLLKNTKTNKCFKLNKKEFDLLFMLVLNLGNITNKNKIIEKIWDGDYSKGLAVNNYIAKLRKLLSSDTSVQIETILREGYILTVKK